MPFQRWWGFLAHPVCHVNCLSVCIYYWQVLVERSHALLHDEIVITVYNMAAVDFASFYGEFLRQFLQTTAAVDAQHVTQLLAMFNAEEASVLKG